MSFETASDRVKNGFRQLIQPLVDWIARSNLHPNVMTLISVGFCVVAAILWAVGWLAAAGIVVLLGGWADIMDGMVARAQNRAGTFGALFDSSLDRLAELFMFIGIGYFFATSAQFDGWHGLTVILVALAFGASVMVSYVRARAESLGYDCSVGILQRPERFILLALGSFFSSTWLLIAVILIALVGFYTTYQRLVFCYRADID